MDEAAVVRLARAQHGLITRSQVASAGGSDEQIKQRVATGRWQRHRRGVYVVGAAATTWEQRALAACFAAGPNAVVSHRSGARLWGFVERSGRLEVTLAVDRRVRLEGVTVHRSRLLPMVDRTRRNGIPVTSVARTLVDASVNQDPATVGRWIDEALRWKLLRLAELRRCVARLARPGRGGLHVVRHELARRLPGYDPGDSELEVRALEALRTAGLPDPVQQHRVALGDGRTAVLDLAYPDELIAIELDGWDAHGTRTAFDGDRWRANELALLGWSLLRFTSATRDPDLARTVSAALARAQGEAVVGPLGRRRAV